MVPNYKDTFFLVGLYHSLGSAHILHKQLRGEGGVSQMLMFVDMGGGGC